jgi:hypothetical protein
MAEKIDTWPLGNKPRREKYPWDDWLDGGVWVLTSPKDFRCKMTSMRDRCYRQAWSRGLNLRTMTTGKKKLIIQALPRNVNEPVRKVEKKR